MLERPVDQSAAPRRRTDRVLGIILPVVGGVLAITGAILLLTPDPPATFGWVASVPLSVTACAPTPWFSSPVHTEGGILLGIGVGVLVFCLGWGVGQRSRSAATRSGRAG